MAQDREEIASEGSAFDGGIRRPAGEQDDWHSRWLAMQAAYAEYRRSSDALERTRHTGDDPTASDHLRLTMLEGQQRVAFERYIDARIAFLESRFDEINRADAVRGAAEAELPAEGGNEDESRIKEWLSIASGRPALQTLGVVLLCTMAVSLMRQQVRIRGLEAGRDDLRAALLSTGHEVQQLRERLDASSAPTPPLSQRTQRAPAEPAPLRPFVMPRPAGKKPPSRRNLAQQRPPRQADGSSRTPARGTANRHAESRPICAFSLSPSHEFKRVGPIQVRVRAVNAQKGTAALAIATDATHVDLQDLRLNEPVWLNIAGYSHPLSLVAERMTGNRIDGRLWETDGPKRDLRASQFRPKLDSTP